METSQFRILVLDNFDPWRRFVSSALQARPDLHLAGQAKDGVEGIQKASELRPDLVLLDIRLPHVDGLRVAKFIRKALPDARILFATHDHDAELVSAAFRDGAHGYLLKPDAATELLPAIDAVLRGEKFVSVRVNR